MCGSVVARATWSGACGAREMPTLRFHLQIIRGFVLSGSDLGAHRPRRTIFQRKRERVRGFHVVRKRPAIVPGWPISSDSGFIATSTCRLVSLMQPGEGHGRVWGAGGREEGASKRFTLAQEQWQALAEDARKRGDKDPPGKPNRRDYQNPAEGRIPAGPLNAMIMPLAGLNLRGVLFYQGENNSFGDAWIPFRETFPAVISDWRRLFRNNDLPFGMIQIAGWSTRRSMTYDMNHHTNVVREVQFNTWRSTSNTGLIVSFDANSNSSIHPGRKYPVGDRAARWALSEVHGVMDDARRKPLQWRGPVYESMKKEKDRIHIAFEEGSDEGLRLERADARGFYIAGRDKIFHHAEARVIAARDAPPQVEVWSDDVPDPVAVRYAWSNLPLGSLMNGKELPAYPFRTDTWPLKPHYGEALYEIAPGDEG